MKVSSTNKNHFAFTLAEVLITLGIIGIVAAMTIPTLLQNQQDKATVSKVKKAYTTLSQAIQSAIQENGTPDNWWSSTAAMYDTTGTENMINYLPLRYVKNCGTTDDTCGPYGVLYRYAGGNNWTSFAGDAHLSKAKLADGTILYAILFNPINPNSYGIYLVDINGQAGPNRLGFDTFTFALQQTGVAPNRDSSTTFAASCKLSLTTPSTSGFGCTSWVLYKENLDYLKCSDLDWDTKTQCN